MGETSEGRCGGPGKGWPCCQSEMLILGLGGRQGGKDGGREGRMEGGREVINCRVVFLKFCQGQQGVLTPNSPIRGAPLLPRNRPA